jgi:probable phosphoglycerate mutase
MATPDGVVPGNIYLFRHGETEWSLSGQHTGTTDLPLLPEGEAAARELADVLRRHRFERVLVSPLQRAKRTAELAGLGDFEVEPLLREWDYGAYEGVTTKQISAEIGHPWEVFVDGVQPGVTPGETVDEVSARAQQVIDKVWPDLEHGDVALFGHGHALRVLTATFLGLDPRFGQHLILDAGSMSVLTHHRSTRCLGMYNLSPWRLLADLRRPTLRAEDRPPKKGRNACARPVGRDIVPATARPEELPCAARPSPPPGRPQPLSPRFSSVSPRSRRRHPRTPE